MSRPIRLRSFLIMPFHKRPDLHRGLFTVVFLLEFERIPSSILATCSVNFNFVDVKTLNILGERYNL